MIICCGEALIDMIPETTGEGSSAFVPHPGGAVFNTAIALGRLGVETSFLGGMSQDFFGDQLRVRLSESGVDFSLIEPSGHPTTLAFVQLVDGQAKYSFYDEKSAGRMFGTDASPVIPDHISGFFIGGINLIAEPCASTNEALLDSAQKRCPVMFDPNIRPMLVTDPDAYRRRIERMLALSDIVKVSDEDLDWLLPVTQTGEQIRWIAEKGPSIVIRTTGRDGATAHTRQFEISCPGKAVDVVDTVGAGDTFNAGFMAHLLERDAFDKQRLSAIGEDILYDALAFGVEVASITVSRNGANPPWAGELRRADANLES